jgi:KipI family sensor histidine kinase inhibitor
LSQPRLLPVGDAALSVEFGDAIDPALNARVRGLDRALRDRPFPGFREAAPTYRSLLVLYDPRAVSFAEACAALGALADAAPAADLAGRLVTVPTRYGGDDGPDLAEVARAHGLTEAAAVAAHSSHEYTAFMLGFMAGFAYLGRVAAALETPRRPTPRLRVPAGSVAIAGRQTGIYPATSPGGWNLIGRTSVRLFDPLADPPSLIQAGDRVRFVPVDELPPPAAPTALPPPARAPALEVLEPGLLTTVQDRGRPGWRRAGVGGSGPMDGPALGAANHAVGNAAGAAALECTVAGPRLRFLATTRFALVGGDLSAVLHRDDLGAWPVPLGAAVLARAGNVLAFGARRSGSRTYAAFAGGIDVPEVLGSRSTDLTAGFGGLGGRALRSGDLIALGGRGANDVEPRQRDLARVDPHSATSGGPGGAGEPPRLDERAGIHSARADDATVRVILGPQDDHFGPEALAAFLGETYTLAPESDRVGCRLQGPRLAHRGVAEIVTDGMVPGCVQVPPDGQPIVMMAGGPTTGGYPKIATVVSADLPALAQLLPGEGRVRFRAVSVEEAQEAMRGARDL